jgi:hypothetical protein
MSFCQISEIHSIYAIVEKDENPLRKVPEHIEIPQNLESVQGWRKGFSCCN